MNREDLRNVLRDMNEGYKEMKEEFEDKTDYVLDTSGQNCPLPIIKTKKELNTMKIGETLKMISTDPGAVMDIQSLCTSLKQGLEKTVEEDNKFIFIIRKTT
tara:strand:- start:784 stop:1089 length:306 start_codon:yes stop_codon:yes gene_type:complete